MVEDFEWFARVFRQGLNIKPCAGGRVDYAVCGLDAAGCGSFSADGSVGNGWIVCGLCACDVVGGKWSNVLQSLSLDYDEPSKFGDKNGRDLAVQRYDGYAGNEVLLLDCGDQFGGHICQFLRYGLSRGIAYARQVV